ncbi:MAG: hypothetical protein R3D33_11605 [Hyphomicrobiaceae bacterium]
MRTLISTSLLIFVLMTAAVMYLSVARDPLGGEPYATVAVEPPTGKLSTAPLGGEVEPTPVPGKARTGTAAAGGGGSAITPTESPLGGLTVTQQLLEGSSEDQGSQDGSQN